MRRIFPCLWLPCSMPQINYQCSRLSNSLFSHLLIAIISDLPLRGDLQTKCQDLFLHIFLPKKIPPSREHCHAALPHPLSSRGSHSKCSVSSHFIIHCFNAILEIWHILWNRSTVNSGICRTDIFAMYLYPRVIWNCLASGCESVIDGLVNGYHNFLTRPHLFNFSAWRPWFETGWWYRLLLLVQQQHFQGMTLKIVPYRNCMLNIVQFSATCTRSNCNNRLLRSALWYD